MLTKALLFVFPAVATGFGIECLECPVCDLECPVCDVEEPEVVPPGKGGPIACDIAEAQSPRDVSESFIGQRTAHMLPLEDKHRQRMVHANTHFHLGAEHRSEGQYDSLEYHLATMEEVGDLINRRRLLDDGKVTVPGYFCQTMADALTEEQTVDYEFQYCKNTEVGLTYEIHWVYSSGASELGPGLGGALDRQANPSIIVQGQVFVIVNDPSMDYDLLNGATFLGLQDESDRDLVAYMGSTTGQSYNHEMCSPYAINWHVDRKCHLVSAQSFDDMCRRMIEKGMEADAEPHGSRMLVGPELASVELMTLVD